MIKFFFNILRKNNSRDQRVLNGTVESPVVRFKRDWQVRCLLGLVAVTKKPSGKVTINFVNFPRDERRFLDVGLVEEDLNDSAVGEISTPSSLKNVRALVKLEAN